jgi:peptide-methionine (S)-S-oxide reductase
VGYAGGTTANPTYRGMGDHSETIEFDYDPDRISFAELLDVFWKNHNSLRKDRSRQYRSVLFCHDDDQMEKALKKKSEWEQILEETIQTEIASYTSFFLAEDYHQKYYLRRYKTAFQTLRDQFPNEASFVQSTLSARLNGFVKGFGTWGGIKREIEDWDLSPSDEAALLQTLNSLRW